jgi:hypothetical protein
LTRDAETPLPKTVLPGTVEFDRTSWRPTLRIVWRAFWVSRLFVAAFVYLGAALRNPDVKIIGGWTGVENALLNPWTTFDSFYFLRIAQHGYDSLELTAFFPLYPSLLRIAGPSLQAQAALGIALSNICLLGGLALTHRLIADLPGAKGKHNGEATRAVWLLAFWPATPYFSAVYSDSLFFLLATAAFWCAHRKHWLRAGVLALGASLARNAAPVLFLALLAEYARAYSFTRSETTRPLWRARDVLLLVVSPLLFVALQWFFRVRFGGDVLLHAQRMFGRSLSSPWEPVWRDLADFATVKHIGPSSVFNLAAALLAPFFAVQLWRRTHGGALLLAGLTLMALLYGRDFAPSTFGAARYVAAAWPFALGLALFYDCTEKRPMLRGLFDLLWVLMCGASAYMFGLKESLF